MNYRDWRQELQKWHSLEGFRDKVRDLRSEHGRDLLTASGTGFYREAHTASRFACLCMAARVRLVAADRPDFEMDVADGARAFEVTEADMPGRKRNNEVKGWVEDRVEEVKDWLTPDIAVQILRAAAARKSDGRYEPGWGLLILLNPWNFGADQQAIEALMADATTAARDRFAEVWVLWQDTAYNPWLGGVPGHRVLRRHDGQEDQGLVTPGS